MTLSPPTLHMLCGKIASGKSTLAARLAQQPGTVLMAEDDWLHALFADDMSSAADYMHYSARLRQIIGPHVAALLNSGLSVVLDFQANTVESRAWMRGILQATQATHQLHVLAASDAACLARLRQRNAGGEHAFAVTETQFREVTRHYVAPTPEEGFTLIIHGDAG